MDASHGPLQVIQFGMGEGVGGRSLLWLTCRQEGAQEIDLLLLSQSMIVDLEMLKLLIDGLRHEFGFRPDNNFRQRLIFVPDTYYVGGCAVEIVVV